MSFTPFNPTPEAAAKVLADLLSPANSLLHVTAIHNTTLEALSLWINTDEVQARLTAQGSAAASITRLLAANHTQIALEAIVTATRESRALLAAAPQPALPTDAGPESAKVRVESSPKAQVDATTASANANPAPLPTLREYYFQLEFRRRLVESLRKNSNLIFRLTRFQFFEPSDLPRPESKPRTARPAQAQAARPDINHDQLLQLLSHIAPGATTAPPAARASNPAPAPRAPQPIAHPTPDAGPESSKVRVESPPKAPVESSPKVRASTTPTPAPRPAPNSVASNTSVLQVRTAIPVSAPDTEALPNPLTNNTPHPGLPRPRAPASLLAAAGRPVLTMRRDDLTPAA